MGSQESLVIAGAGGYGCELAAVCRIVGRSPLGVLDDGTPDLVRLGRIGVDLLGVIDAAPDLASSFLVGIGYPTPRLAVTDRLLAFGLEPAPGVAHPSAVILGRELGDDPVQPGTVVFPNSTVSTNVALGRHVLVNYNATVGHDTVVGDGTTIGPGAQIGGECELGRGVLIGSGAVVLQGLSVGDGARIGSGAVVVRDVGPNELILGVPGRIRVDNASQ